LVIEFLTLLLQLLQLLFGIEMALGERREGEPALLQLDEQFQDLVLVARLAFGAGLGIRTELLEVGRELGFGGERYHRYLNFLSNYY
jgi:hypothetical protein